MSINRIKVLRCGIAVVASLCLALIAGESVFSEETEEDEVIYYSNDFEKTDDVSSKPNTNVSETTINFKGLSEEKAHSGKKSLKLDITLQGEGGFCYFNSPGLKIPLEEAKNLVISGYVLLPERVPATAVKFGFDFRTSAASLPRKGGSFAIPSSTVMVGRWIYYSSESGEIYNRIKAWAIKKNVDPSEIYISMWHIHIVGWNQSFKDGKRIVAYFDDVKVYQEEEEEIY